MKEKDSEQIGPNEIFFAGHKKLNEKSVQKLIGRNPSVLGLGGRTVDLERSQPSGGRVDILLVDYVTHTQFVVELKLNSLDADHIIRAIEYWIIEIYRTPKLKHVAVLVVESISDRLHVVLTFLSSIMPLVVIKMKSIKVDDGTILSFTKIIDQRILATLQGNTADLLESIANHKEFIAISEDDIPF